MIPSYPKKKKGKEDPSLTEEKGKEKKRWFIHVTDYTLFRS